MGEGIGYSIRKNAGRTRKIVLVMASWLGKKRKGNTITKLTRKSLHRAYFLNKNSGFSSFVEKLKQKKLLHETYTHKKNSE